MKKRFLPFNFFLGLIALSVVFSASVLYAGNGNHVTGNKDATSYLNLLRNNQNTGIINPQMVALANEMTENMSTSRDGNEIDWKIMGPYNYGGRTRAVLYDSKDESGKTVFAGAVSGGIWRSTDNGVTWKKVNTAGQNLYVSCMTQGSDGTIYVGTGESFDAQGFSQLGQLGYSSGFMGSGIYKSSDGENFELISSTKPQSNTPSLDWAFVNGISIDANGRIYAATNTGLKYSDDKGGSWKTAKDSEGSELTGNTYDVEAGDGIVASVDNQCYVSSGDANGFVNHSTGEANQLPLSDKIIRAEFAVAPSDNKTVYVSLINETGFLKGIYQSKDGGETWEVILPETSSLRIYFGLGEFANALTVFPDNPDKVLVGGVDLWVGYKTDERGLFFWEQKSSAFDFPFSSTYVAMGQQSYAFRPGHAGQFMIGTNSGLFKGEISGSDFAFKPANSKYYTTQFYRAANSGIEDYVIGGAQDNGVLKMTNETNSYGYAVPVVGAGGSGGDAVISLINPDVVVYGFPRGRVYRSEDKGETVSNQFISGFKNDNAFLTPVALWESFNNENSRDSIWFHAREDIEAGATITIRSNNSGYPFHYTLPAGTGLAKGDSIQVVDPISSRFFIAVEDAVYMTKELHYFAKTPEWFRIAGDITGFVGIPTAIAYSGDCNHLWVGTTDGKIYRISNLALAYNKELADISKPTCIVANSTFEINDPETGDPITQAVTSISVDPQNPTKVLVTFGNYGNAAYVFYADDALDAVPDFKSKQGNLPKMPVYSSIIEMSDSKKAIIGTENGIFSTNDITAGTPSWSADGEAMGKVPVFDLRQQTVAQKKVVLTLINGTDTTDFVYPGATNYGMIYAGTYGRGIFKTSTYRKPVGIGEIFTQNGNGNKSSLKVYPNPVRNMLYFNLNVKRSETANVVVYNQAGMAVKTMKVSLRNGSNTVNFDVSMLSTGSYIIKVVYGSTVKTQKFIKL